MPAKGHWNAELREHLLHDVGRVGQRPKHDQDIFRRHRSPGLRAVAVHEQRLDAAAQRFDFVGCAGGRQDLDAIGLGRGLELARIDKQIFFQMRQCRTRQSAAGQPLKLDLRVTVVQLGDGFRRLGE